MRGQKIIFKIFKNDYESSEIKYVVDAWAKDNFQNIKEARLIKIDEINSIVEYEQYNPCDYCSTVLERISEKLSWLYNKDYSYWTMSPYQNYKTHVWRVTNYGSFYNYFVGKSPTGSDGNAVRPVIIISKSALGDIDDSKSDDNDKQIIPDKQEDKKGEISTKVSVANTYLKKSVIIIILGFILSCISVTIYYIIRKRKKE